MGRAALKEILPSSIANQVKIDILVMSNGDRNASAAKRKSSQHLPLTTKNLEPATVSRIIKRQTPTPITNDTDSALIT